MPNTSAPVPIFRVGGANFDIDSAMSAIKMDPYRSDRAGMDRARVNAIYFDIAAADATTGILSDVLEKFLAANREDLRQLREMPGVDFFELDIGATIDDGMMSRSTTLGPKLMAALAALDITCTISAYRGGEE